MAKVVPNARYIERIVEHTAALPPESNSPIRHYERNANDAWSLVLYVDRNLIRANTYATSRERHLGKLHGMALLALVEGFERFLKEIAAVCVDNVAEFANDDRLKKFTVSGPVAAAHFAERSVGRALCESSTWLDCDEIDERFRSILKSFAPTSSSAFFVFPKPNQGFAGHRDRRDTISLIFQMRHTLVHNAGVITTSDAVKLRRILKKTIESPRLLAPTRPDVWYVKSYLDHVVQSLNQEIASELSLRMNEIIGMDVNAFGVAERAQALADLFQVPITISNATKLPT